MAHPTGEKESEKDRAQDRMIAENAVRIARNEEAIKRQTEALEQIRDHYYPPPDGLFKKCAAFSVKVVCVIVAYLGIAQTVDWIWNARESDSRAAQLAEIAQRLFEEEGDASGAIACYEKALKLNPKKSEYVMAMTFLRGMALSADFVGNDRMPTDAEQVKIDAALSEATVLATLEPESPLPQLLMAQAFVLSGENDSATAAVARAVARAPEKAAVRVRACALLFLAGQPAAARVQLTEAKRLDATLPLVGIWDGTLKLKLDRDAAGAAACFRAAIRRTPRFPIAHFLLARALLAGDSPHLPTVRASFYRAFLLDARLTCAMVGMAETYEREGDLVMARLWLDRAIEIDGKYLPARVARARLSGKAGDWKAAVSDLSAAIALATYRTDLYRLRAEAYDRTGEAALAKADRATAAALTRAVKEFL